MSRELSENGKYELLKIDNYTKLLLLLLLLLENHAKAQKLHHMRYAIKSARPRYFCILIIYLCIISCSCVIAIYVCLIGWHLSAINTQIHVKMYCFKRNLCQCFDCKG